MRRAFDMTPEISQSDFDLVVEQVDAIKASMDPPPGIDKPLGKMFKAYQDLLERAESQDFSDMLRRAVFAMKSGEISPLPVDFMLVDEAQDMDEVQYEWMQCHVANGTRVTIVGDDDQSIFGWRSAMGYRGMTDFVKKNKAEHLVLSVNYRSSAEIINAATRLITHNKTRVIKSIHPHVSEPGTIEVIKVTDRKDEAHNVLRVIRQNPDAGWAVLARTNRLLGWVECALRAAKIPCVRVGGKSFWEEPEPSVFLGLLRSLSRNDAIGAIQALQWAGVSSRIINMIHDRHPKDNASLIKVLTEIRKSLSVEDRPTKKVLSGFIARNKEWRQAVASSRIRLVVSGVARWCESHQGKQVGGDKKSIFGWCEDIFNKLSGSIDQRIHFLTQRSKDTQDSKAVKLMTLHASKGLEFPNVWILAVEDGVLPLKNSDNEEERRLFYVGITRAQRRLIISHSITDVQPSMFLEEAGIVSGV
ncbi:hypothetical protein GSUB_16740 (plasmid) [Geoalkalibacter subterraneus]|uniref:DNA 3'-5' helicase n=1 Tax=Geoalkalibacter subterraneus TaxID=483547 RepID=A0A0B5FTZ6_9BACT|nr:hypothetical protein GSUB_16740 [Geoalkalibacter subterraneus]